MQCTVPPVSWVAVRQCSPSTFYILLCRDHVRVLFCFSFGRSVVVCYCYVPSASDQQVDEHAAYDAHDVDDPHLAHRLSFHGCVDERESNVALVREADERNGSDSFQIPVGCRQRAVTWRLLVAGNVAIPKVRHNPYAVKDAKLREGGGDGKQLNVLYH